MSKLTGSTLVRGLLVGVALAAVVLRRYKEFEVSLKVSGDTERKRRLMAMFGRSLLSEPHKEEQGLTTYLRQKYLALFFVGRAGGCLYDSELDALATELRHFHSQLDRTQDAALVKWYQTVGVGQGIPLVRLLQTLPEIKDLEIDPIFIAMALRQVPIGDFNADFSDVERLRDWLEIK